MASTKRTKNGTFEIRFMVGKHRRSYYPGPKTRTETQAEDIAKKLERLTYCTENDESPPGHITKWLKSLPDAKHTKLSDWGLVERRKLPQAATRTKLDEWCTDYIKRGKRKESTRDQLEDVQRNLTTFFGKDRLITSVTAGDAEDFRVWLETEGREVTKDAPPAGLAMNTVRRRLGRAREFFNLALKRKLIEDNPFAGETVTVGANPDRQFFVPADWIDRCIVTCGCEDWRIMLAFARYAGMRSHETRLQRWEDIDIPKRKMTVRSQKNPPQRVCPIFPELLPHLMRAKEMAPEGAELLVTRYTPSAGINETFKKIVKRAGLTAWPKLMQNLRATRETELIADYPIKDVSSWLGNSSPIAMKHYAMTMKSSFERAIEFGAINGGRKPPQNPPHSIATNGSEQHLDETDEIQNTVENEGFAAGDCPPFPLEVPRAGLEPARPYSAGGF